MIANVNVIDKVQSEYSLYGPNNVQEIRRTWLSYFQGILEYN
jgi:hypothetical protein